MRLVIITALAAGLFFVSCGKDKETKADEPKKETVKNFTMTVNAVVDKDDIFQIFYTEDGTDQWQDTQSLLVPVKGSSKSQDVVFKLPEDAMPTALRFDIGGNKDIKQVAFNGFNIKYEDKIIDITKDQFFKNFQPSYGVEADTINIVAKTLIIGGNGYDPILTSTAALNAELSRLYN